MKRNSITTSAIIALTILLGFIAVQGQARGRYFGDIPFDFAFGKDIYDAGRYELILELPGYDANIFTLRDGDGKTLERAVVLRSGNRSKDDNVKFVFDQYEHGSVLKEVVGPGFGFSAQQPSEAVWFYITENRTARPERVIVAFRKGMKKAP